MAEKTKDEKPEKKVSPSNGGEAKPFYKHVPLMAATGVAVVGLFIVGFFAFQASKDSTQTGEQAQEAEDTSLGGQLENVEFDESLSEEDRELHDLSVASAYMAEENYDKALELYLAAESNGIADTRLFQDIATIYEEKEDLDSRDEYLAKLADAQLQEIDRLDDPLSKAGSYLSLARTYQKLGDNEKARGSYQKAIDTLESANNLSNAEQGLADETIQAAQAGISEL